VVLPRGRIAAGKLLQAQAAGARVVAVDGNFDDALRIVREMADQPDPDHPVTLVNSVNPYRIEGQKTAAFEVCEDLGGAPDYLAIPVGNAGNITAYWRGFQEYRDTGLVETTPKMLGFQAEGASPLVQGHDFDDPQTIATAIRIGRPASGAQALAARDESGGLIDAVSDDEILAAYRDVARYEGIFCEPASAASVAGVRKAVADGRIDPGTTIVAVLTGLGLKDPDTAMTLAQPPIDAEPSVEAVRSALGW
jgi:threonine synthase